MSYWLKYIENIEFSYTTLHLIISQNYKDILCIEKCTHKDHFYVCPLLILCAWYLLHCIAITQTKRNINCRLWWCTKFSQKNCDCFVVLIPHDVYHLANKNFFYLQKDLFSLNEINHVIVLRIFVLADYANASLNGL